MKNIFSILFLISAQFAFAQSELPEGFGDYRTIENPQHWKTYSQGYIPPKLKKIIWRDSVLLLRNNQHLIKSLEKGKDYEINTEIIEIRPYHTIWEFNIPNFKDTNEFIWASKTIIVNNTYEEFQSGELNIKQQTIKEKTKFFEADSCFIYRPKALQADGLPLPVSSHVVFTRFVENPYRTVQKKVFEKIINGG